MLGAKPLNLEQWILGYHFGSTILEPNSRNGPSRDEVLFNKNLSLVDMLRPKIAYKFTLEALSSRATLDPKIRLDLRCMYVFRLGELDLLSTCST